MNTMTDDPVLGYAIDRAYRAIDHDPQVLLETDGGPVGMKAHLYVARLYGFDDQIDRQMFLDAALPEVYLPIAPSDTMWAAESFEPMRVATYVLQSGYSLVAVDSTLLPPGTPHGNDFRCKVLCLRYRRQMPAV